MPSKRKSKNDRKAKARYNKYKRGGQHRVDGFVLSNKRQGNDGEKRKK